MPNSAWISVEKRLPTNPGMKLIHAPSADTKLPFITVAWFEPKGTKNMYGWQLLPKVWCDAITHWQELPGPPEKGEVVMNGGDKQ